MFKNRTEAGKRLGALLLKYKAEKPIVLALPRGGVIVGYEISTKLKAPFSVIVSRKIAAPSMPEFGIGAVSEDGVYIDKANLKDVGMHKDQLEVLIKLQEEEVKRRVKLYRKGRKLPNFSGKTIILVDDGLATGVTVFAAIEALKKLKARKIIFAAPVCDVRTTSKLRNKVEFVECLMFPHLTSVGSFYRNFEQVSDKEVLEVLEKSGY